MISSTLHGTHRGMAWSTGLLALLFITILGGIQLYYFDITIHGPDQIRDMEIARRLVQDHEWPVNGPPMFGERIHPPPGFYYLLALPLLLHDSDVSVFITFGLLFVLSTFYLWRQVNQILGRACGIFYTILAFPLFYCIYAHSAWSPGLIITFSNVLLGLYLQYIERQQSAWLALPWVFFLLVQIHPSAAPLIFGFAIYGIRNTKIFRQKATWFSLISITFTVILWLLIASSNGSAPASVPQSLSTWLDNLKHTAKWRDAFLMPYHLMEGVQPTSQALKMLSAIFMLIMLTGLLFCLLPGTRKPCIRWLAVSFILWFFACMAFLSHGGFWHLDVIHPWLAVCSAWGWSRAVLFFKLSGLRCNVIAITFFSINFSSHIIFYQQLVRDGKFDWLISSMFFPRPPASDIIVPTYTYKNLTDFRNMLSHFGICREQLAGIIPMSMAEATNRYFEISCPEKDVQEKLKNVYFVMPKNEITPFSFTQKLQPLATTRANSIYRIDHLPTTINGTPSLLVVNQKKSNYMTYLPAYLADGLIISTNTDNHKNVMIRLALRCSEEYPAFKETFWRIHGGTPTHPLVFKKHQYLSFYYYDLEWILEVRAHGNHPYIEIRSTQTPMHCDVSAIARPAP